MTTKNKLALAAFAGLFTAGVMAASPAFADHHDKGACSGASGCKGKAGTEKANCKSADGEKHACKGDASTDKHECKSKAECKTKAE